MTTRQIIYASTIIVLGCIQLLPCMLIVSSTIIGSVLGTIYMLLLVYFWSSTIIGRWYFRELWRSTLRLENFIFQPLGKD